MIQLLKFVIIINTIAVTLCTVFNYDVENANNYNMLIILRTIACFCFYKLLVVLIVK